MTSIEDHSCDTAALVRQLRAEGVVVRELVEGLDPRYAIVWRDIGLGYAGLLGTMGVLGWMAPGAWIEGVAAVLVGGLLIGAFMAYLQLFTHEAAHHNLARRRAVSDRLANAVLTVWLGQEITQYRKVHFKHHRYLGTVQDTERSYFSRPGWKLLLESLMLVHLFRVFRSHGGAKDKDPQSQRRAWRQFVLGVGLNGAVVLVAFLTAGWAVAAAWVVGILCFFPFFSTWRQLLEHRHPDAQGGTDYRAVDHGAYTRRFGTSFFSRLFGGAGFNRHLLHHWFPQVSYTRFDDLEARVRQSPYAAAVLDARRSSYPGTFRTLWMTARGHHAATE